MKMGVKRVQMWTDGGSRGNPGEAAIGIVLKENGQVIFEEGTYLGSLISNNQAEYQALYQGLLRAKSIGASEVESFLDSQLVVEQLNGRYKVKDAGLREWWNKIKDLSESFAKVSFAYVPRADNSIADGLVNQALDKELSR